MALKFDNVLGILLIFTAAITPFEIAFLEQEVSTVAGTALFSINRIVDIGFMMDIYVQFRIARYDKDKGVWITSRSKLFWLYLQSTFLIDLCSTIPWDLLGFFINVQKNVKMMRLLKLLKMAKLVRIYKSSRMFKRMKSKFRLKSSEYNLMKYATVFVMALHWTACGWGIFPQLDTSAYEMEQSRRRLLGFERVGTLYDGRNWVDRMSEVMGHELSALDKYALSIDYALACMCMGYGTVEAKTITEVWFSIGCMMLAGAVYAYVIGGICEALSNEDPSSKQFRESMDMLNGFFRKQPVSMKLRQQCHSYMEVYHSKIEESVYNKVLNLFPPQLQQRLAVSMMATLVQDAQVLKWGAVGEEDIFKKEVALHFECAVYPQQENIYKQGQVSDAMYVVNKGLVRTASSFSSCSVSLFAQGHCFGWEMIRNVAFPVCDKYKRINSADSFTVVLLQKLRAVHLREALMLPELCKTAKRIKRAAHWCLVRQRVVQLGTSVLIVKAGAGLPPMTPAEKRQYKAFYTQVAKRDAAQKKTGEPGRSPPNLDEIEDGIGMEATAEHLDILAEFGGGFLENLQQRNPTTNFDQIQSFVPKPGTPLHKLRSMVGRAKAAQSKLRAQPLIPQHRAPSVQPLDQHILLASTILSPPPGYR
jgi:hypothetical protein